MRTGQRRESRRDREVLKGENMKKSEDERRGEKEKVERSEGGRGTQ